eukprot:INCI17582.2.p1 GENE.INCI17582.2~~INCI17582.2.p1  ORF type:complete len:429 (+),score=38.46 INCI17582.2:311-1597(+)
MLGLLCYVGIYQIWYKGGYQKITPFEGAVDVKVKGAGYLGGFETCPNGIDWPSCGPYDTYDTSVPPQQEGAVFIATSFYSTPKQTRGLCNSPFRCTTDADCSHGLNGTGSDAIYLTGKCVADANTTSANHCEMAAWCPPEVSKDVLNENKHNLSDTGDFTVFFRVDGSFSELGSNFSTGDDLVYNYNLFYLSDLIAYSQGVDVYPTANLTKHEKLSGRPSNGPFDNVLGSGTVIFLKATIMANTNSSTLENPKPCDLDYADPDCKILFSFTRVDPTENPKSASFGYNFRYTNPWSLADTGTRSLTKVYGTRIVFQVVGDGAQFDVLTLTVAIGSGIGILSLAKVACDFILQYLCGTYHPKYTKSKYEIVEEYPGENLEDDDHDSGLSGVVDKRNLLAESDPEYQVNGVVDEEEEKVGCWRMCQVRLCC